MGDYSGIRQQIVLCCKRAQQDAVVNAMGRLMASRLRVSTFLEGADLVLPMPAHRLRRFNRWYNSAELIARPIARAGRLEIRTNLLKYKRSTRKQGTLTHAQRLLNLKDSMKIRIPERIRGRTVVIVDDVMTSGATSNEAARVCLRAGAAEVRVAVFARGAGLAAWTP